MTWIAIINEIFDIFFLSSLLVLLLLIWRSSERRTKQSEAFQQAIIDVAKENAESTRQSVENTRILAALLLNEQAESKPQ